MPITNIIPGPHISEEAPSSTGRRSADKCTQASMAMAIAAIQAPQMSQQACIDYMYKLADHMETVGDFHPGTGSTFAGAYKELLYNGLKVREYHPFSGGPLPEAMVHDTFQTYAGKYPLIVQYLQAHMLIDTAHLHQDTNVQCHAIYHPAIATDGYPTADPNNPTVMQTLDTYPWEYDVNGVAYGIKAAQVCAMIVLDRPAPVPTPQPPPPIPSGWHDDGTTLTASNGVAVVGDFRSWCLVNMATLAFLGLPLAPEWTEGDHTFLTFDFGELRHSATDGVFVANVGADLEQLRQQNQAYQAEAVVYAQIKTLVEATK